MKDLDDILASDPVIEPSAGFSARVMAQVRDADRAPAPIEFPWRRFLPGVITCAAVILIGFVLILTNIDFEAVSQMPPPESSLLELEILESPPVVGAIALFGSLLLGWAAVRYARGGQRQELF